MPIALHHERENVYRVDISGTLMKADLDRCQKCLATEIDRVGQVRLLIVLTEFNGWQTRADWSDLTFYANHGATIERIAIVGPPRWKSQTLMFAGADLRPATVEFFPVGAAGVARDWLSS